MNLVPAELPTNSTDSMTSHSCAVCGRDMTVVHVEPHRLARNLAIQLLKCRCGNTAKVIAAR